MRRKKWRGPVKKILIISAILATLGCAEIIQGDIIAMEGVGKAVSIYCKLPEKARAMNRARWDTVLAPNHIEITCN